MKTINEKDAKILRLLQKNCRITAREIAKRIGSPITTVYTRIRKMEELGVIKHYKAILDFKKLDKGTTAFILVSFAYRPGGREKPLSQKDVAKQIAAFPEVQEAHIITGGWDILIKARTDHVDTLGKLVLNKLRMIEGVENTLSCIVYETVKETTDILT